MPTEADTCRKLVVPKLQGAGWDNEPYSIAEQRTITDGRIVPVGNSFIRRPPKRVDYILQYRRDFPLAVVEAKPEYKTAADGLQQAKQYAEMLGLKFAYATNGAETIEFDYFTGKETKIESYPTPEALWQRFRKGESLTSETAAQQLLTPINFTLRQGERYYQEIAINRAVEAIVTGKRRILLTMATGTGKTPVAFQICWKLWNARWNRTGEHRRPKILYLSDRNILIDDPKDKIFAQFGDARAKIEYGHAIKSREVYFAIYQALAEDERRPGLYKEYARDFFDLIIIDECHRGSARDESNWREILKYFEPAYQLGMTATPLRDETRDTYLYFGNPIYQYSLRQGIEDGFLAPYRVHRFITQWDAAGWRPSKDDIDRYGRRIPDEVYGTPDFERKVALLTLYASAPELRQKWANPLERSEIIDKLAERGISFDELAETAKQPNADPFDLLCHLAFNAPLRTRRERAQRLREERKDFFDRYSAEGRAILGELLDKYAEYGTAQFVLPDVL